MSIEIICTAHVDNDKGERIFKKGKVYQFADDRGEDGAVCMYSTDVSRKIYLSKYNYETLFKEVDYKELAARYLEILEKVNLKLNKHNKESGYCYGLEIGLEDEMNEITDILVKEKL